MVDWITCTPLVQTKQTIEREEAHDGSPQEMDRYSRGDYCPRYGGLQQSGCKSVTSAQRTDHHRSYYRNGIGRKTDADGVTPHTHACQYAAHALCVCPPPDHCTPAADSPS